ncbi:putative RecB family nuclease, family (plasmid) [Piscirickettsia salmonis]|nr:putative RecB family nuclease, family [Piscirickettsia salmonis]
MLREQSDYIFSPSDLTLYMESPFALWMNRYAKEYPDYAPAPDAEDIMGNMLQNKGDEHEQEILKGFAATGLNISDLSHVCDRQAATIGAMKEGVDIIYQGELTLPPFHGYPDFLVKKKGKSRFGNYQYQVYDTKLAKEIKAHFIIQLSCYSEMLAHVQVDWTHFNGHTFFMLHSYKTIQTHKGFGSQVLSAFFYGCSIPRYIQKYLAWPLLLCCSLFDKPAQP